ATRGCSAASTRSRATAVACARARTTCPSTCATSAIPPSRWTPCRSRAPERDRRELLSRRTARETGPFAFVGSVAALRLLPVLALELGLDRVQAQVAQQCLRLVLAQRLHPAQAAFDGAGLAAGVAQALAHGTDLLLGALEDAGELAELALHRAQQAPYLAGPLLDGQGAEAHLQAAEQGGDGGRAGHDDAVLALQGVGQAGTADHLRVQALGRQEHHREVGGVRRHDVLLADRLGLDPDRALQLRAAGTHQFRVGLLLGIDQALVVLARELAVDRQPQRRVVVAAAGQAHGEVHRLGAVRAHAHAARVLLGGK